MSFPLLWHYPLAWLTQLRLYWVELQRSAGAPAIDEMLDEVLPDDGSYANSFPWTCCS